MPAGWRYDGLLCEADNTDTGAMWECPLLFELEKRPDGASRQSSANISREGDAASSVSERSPLQSLHQPGEAPEDLQQVWLPLHLMHRHCVTLHIKDQEMRTALADASAAVF